MAEIGLKSPKPKGLFGINSIRKSTNSSKLWKVHFADPPKGYSLKKDDATI